MVTKDGSSNYWGRLRRQRVTRRSLLRASAQAGVGATGLALVGCGDDDDDEQQAEQQQAQQQQQAEEQQAEPAAGDRPRGGTLESFVGSPPNSLDMQQEILAYDFLGVNYSKLLKQVTGRSRNGRSGDDAGGAG